MKICEDCMKEFPTERNHETPFPSFTVLGGVLGSIFGLITGMVLLVPGTLLVGMGADIIRCERCGRKDKNIHQLLIEMDDGLDTGTKRYWSIPNPLNDNPQQYKYNEVEARFERIDDAINPADTPEFNILDPDYLVDYETSFQVADTSMEVDLDMDPGGDWGSDFGTGDFGTGDGGDLGAGSGGQGGGSE